MRGGLNKMDTFWIHFGYILGHLDTFWIHFRAFGYILDTFLFLYLMNIVLIYIIIIVTE